MKKTQYVITWDEAPRPDWATITKQNMESMYPDMNITIIDDGWKKKEAVLTTTDSAREVKCSFYDVFIKANYGFRNLDVKRKIHNGTKNDNQSGKT